MNTPIRRTYLRTIFAVLGITLVAHAAAAAPNADAPKCSAPEYRQLDFWLGDWDTVETETPTGPSIARARVDRIAQGCAIHELYEQTDGLVGDSILSYDAVRRQWQQTWVTNRGSLMVITGEMHDGALVLEGDVHLQNGTTVKQRITWQAQGKDVRESAVVSKDGGKTWAAAFDVVFRTRADVQTASP